MVGDPIDASTPLKDGKIKDDESHVNVEASDGDDEQVPPLYTGKSPRRQRSSVKRIEKKRRVDDETMPMPLNVFGDSVGVTPPQPAIRRSRRVTGKLPVETDNLDEILNTYSEISDFNNIGSPTSESTDSSNKDQQPIDLGTSFFGSAFLSQSRSGMIFIYTLACFFYAFLIYGIVKFFNPDGYMLKKLEEFR